ncbi:xanthine dehydrogenase family protein molybdopterin-binding subunit [Consotaella salsifontis]|uniref:Xanthine dehydrogenase YagR molybdenum-binding subunit n=1 Tax=Consotaella salsifontis TaxID=1365950 RepID=A0A1T4QQ37_9HYPH|nr:xanthine dehydrogenase family protein molybdopterin-binding subunit [Consotaella salsifontis]SKA05892.1 xanthine dehydrogenase YagR molybdenum-binding subunit [Consotaella salsifontis]
MPTHVMNEALGETRLDKGAQGLIGKPLDRYEGRLKVTGKAPYAYETRHGEGVAYGVVVTAPVAKGKVVSIDTLKAFSSPGVIHVLTGDNLPTNSAQPSGDKPAIGGGQIHFYGQVLALVVADSFEAARHGASLVTVECETREGRYDLDAERPNAKVPPPGNMPPDTARGDFERAFAEAEVKLDETYRTPSQSHSAMEPHAAVAEWQGGQLTVHTSCQLVGDNTRQLAAALGIKPDKVRILTPYIGGGFGGKLGIGPEAVLAAMVAKEIGRPVKVALTRQQVYQVTSRRTDTIQRVRIGATRDGRITAIGHESWCSNMAGDDYFEPIGLSTVFLYAGENRLITHRLAELDVLMASAMRAPGEAVGMLALENAMDEMAEKLGLDPIEFRKRNEPDRNPEDDKPFSSRHLIECMEEGARRFGWSEREARPRARQEGDWLIGIGMAAASRKNLLAQSSAEVRLEPDGRAIVLTDMTDIGTGSYTILAQTAGEMLGLPMDRITVLLGDSALPESSGSGGSFGAASAGSSVYIACEALIERLARKMDCAAEDLTLKDGTAVAGNRQVPLVELLAGEALSAEGTLQPGNATKDHHQASYGAHFCEVAVNAVTGETRVRRMLSVCEAGRILNAKTARSQCLGGMIFGIGTALTEELVIDDRNGLLVNHDLAEYHVPVNADVPQLDVVLLDKVDRLASPMASKGLGELGISGAGAAVTNAIYNACGVRVRDYPATLDKVLEGLAEGGGRQ